ncbi:hypothetical protein HDV62DRAFT_355213 [Trichoderma sp. SZMC 28011]
MSKAILSHSIGPEETLHPISVQWDLTVALTFSRGSKQTTKIKKHISNFWTSTEYCNYFLRFSSKISGSLTMAAEPYIIDVLKIERKYFGRSVHFWHEMDEFGEPEKQYGVHNLLEVHDAEKEPRELGSGKEESG